MKVIERLTGKEFTANYGANSKGNMRMWVDGKFYSDRQFAKKFEIVKSNKAQWRVNTPSFLKEIGDNNPTASMMVRPLMIFAAILEEVATRASELNDPQLNALMCRLALYEISDPYSKEYNREQVEQIIAAAVK